MEHELFHSPPNQYRVKFHVLLTTFELARKEELVNLLRQRRVFFGALVVDEAHRLKGMNSQIWQAIQEFEYQWTLLLTGTPIQNNVQVSQSLTDD
jgi:SNF2 family DNA or RNA helicase